MAACEYSSRVEEVRAGGVPVAAGSRSSLHSDFQARETPVSEKNKGDDS